MVLSRGYDIGRAARMGPGYFPFLLGGLLMVIGATILVHGLSRKGKASPGRPVAWRPLLLVLASVVLFGLLLKPLGFVVSVFLLVLVSSAASHEFRPKEALVSGLILLILVSVIFVYLLQTQVPLWPSFGGRAS